MVQKNFILKNTLPLWYSKFDFEKYCVYGIEKIFWG